MNQKNTDISNLQPNIWNSNHLSPENEEKLEQSIRKIGVFRPIIVRELGTNSYEILGGQHTWEAAKRIGIKTIPIFNLGKISDEQAKKITLADNARYGSDDIKQLSEILESIGSKEEIASFLPYSELDLDSYFSTKDIDIDAELEDIGELDIPDEEYTEPTTKVAKTHTIMRFKVTNKDAERITALIERTKKRFDYTHEDDLTNAGDSLVQIIFGETND